MAEPIDFRALVDRAAQRVEREDGVTIGEDARAVLVRRALEHEAAVHQALRRENLGERDLEQAAVAQFREAPVRRMERKARPLGHHALVGDTASGGGDVRHIDAAAVDEGMKSTCHFVGWC